MVDKRNEADKLIDELIIGKTPEEIVGEGGLLQALTKRLYERALEGEMTHHLGYPPNAPEGRNLVNSRCPAIRANPAPGGLKDITSTDLVIQSVEPKLRLSFRFIP